MSDDMMNLRALPEKSGKADEGRRRHLKGRVAGRRLYASLPRMKATADRY